MLVSNSRRVLLLTWWLFLSIFLYLWNYKTTNFWKPNFFFRSQKLLQKGGDQHIRQSSTDSSGCSSGQESVTSSLTSESHVSGDSGADVDPSSTCNKLLEPSLAWETSSLRQRNVNSGKVSTATDSRWDPYTKLAKSGEVPQLDSVSLTKSSTSLQDEPFASSPQTRSSTGK